MLKNLSTVHVQGIFPKSLFDHILKKAYTPKGQNKKEEEEEEEEGLITRKQEK
jgi:hypothetical protein